MQIIHLGGKKLAGHAWKVEDESRKTGNCVWVVRRRDTSVSAEVWCRSQKSNAVCRGSPGA